MYVVINLSRCDVATEVCGLVRECMLTSLLVCETLLPRYVNWSTNVYCHHSQ